MPGYLSNRVISFSPAKISDVEAVEAAVLEVQADVEDLQLNVSI